MFFYPVGGQVFPKPCRDSVKFQKRRFSSVILLHHIPFPKHSSKCGVKRGDFFAILEARKGIPKNLSSQVLGEVPVNFLGGIPTKSIHFVNIEGPNCSENSWEGFG